MKRPLLSIMGLVALGLAGTTACGGESGLGNGLGGAGTGGLVGTGGFTDTGGTAAGGTSTGGTGSGGASTGGTSSGGSASVWVTTCTAAVNGCATDALIDDFAGTDNAVTVNGKDSNWWTYAPTPATVTPYGDAFAGGVMHIVAAGLTPAIGSVDVSVSLNPVLVGADTVSCALDLSPFTGVKITGKATSAGSGKITVRIVTPDVLPTTAGGTCTTGDCWSFPQKEIELLETEDSYILPFTEFAKPWGTAVALDPTKAIKLLISSTAGTTGFDVELTKIELTGTGTGTCN